MNELDAPQGEIGTPAAPGGPQATPASSEPAAPAAPAKPSFTYEEDRSNWVPSHRIREATQAQQKLERDLQFERQRVAALSGVQPPTAPVSREDQELQAEFYAKFPKLAKLQDKADKLDALLERLGDFDPTSVATAQDHYFEQMGVQTLSRLDSLAESEIGGTLSPFAQQMLHNNFGVWVAGDPAKIQRYERQDPKLLSDFITEYRTGILDPFRRKVTTAQQPQHERARRLPQQGGSGAQLPTGRPGVLKPSDTDDYHSAAFRAMQESGR